MRGLPVDGEERTMSEVNYGGWCAPSPSHCRECGHEICVCYTRPPRPQCVGDCEPECVGMCFLEVTDD